MNCPECDSENYGFVAKPFDNGNGFHVRMQCRDCGYMTSTNFKKEFNEYPTYDKELYEGYEKRKNEIWREEYKKREAERVERITVEKIESKKRWHDENDEYYFSNEWKGKRAYVLRRDNYLCQMCITNTAIHVHHLSYQHFGNELTCELISVCDRCHAIIHEKEPF